MTFTEFIKIISGIQEIKGEDSIRDIAFITEDEDEVLHFHIKGELSEMESYNIRTVIK